MTTDRDIQRAAERFADTVHEDVSTQVRLAWGLERDRLYAELAELRDEVVTLAGHISWLNARVLDAERLHNVKVKP